MWEYRLFNTLSSCIMIEASKKKAKESICMPLKRMPYKKIKTVHDVLEREGGGKGSNKTSYDVLP